MKHVCTETSSLDTFLPSDVHVDVSRFFPSALCEWTRLCVKRSTLRHLFSKEGNTACCDYSVVQYGCTHCNCIPSNALIHTFYITCNFMDFLIAQNYLCLGLLQYTFFSCIFVYFGHAFLAMAVKIKAVGNISVEGCIYTDQNKKQKKHLE